MAKRKRIPDQTQNELLIRSGRRCCLCYGLNGDGGIKDGQIAHIDRDSSNPAFDNLAWLCLEHHNLYDTMPRQSKRFTPQELKEYREQLFDAVEQFRAERSLETAVAGSNRIELNTERLEEPLPPPREPKSEIQRQQERELQRKLDRATDTTVEDEQHAISVEIERAERLVAVEEHAEAADIFAGLASRLAENRQPSQARTYAKLAAKHYLASNDKAAAAKLLFRASEVWLTQTSYEPLAVRSDLEEAEKLATEVQNYLLQARVTLLQAHYFQIQGEPDKCKTLWEKVERLLVKIAGDAQVEIYCGLALQRAAHSRLAEDYAGALEILREADSREWSPQSNAKRLELLWVLLFLEAEVGDWDAADRTYQKAQEILETHSDSVQDGAWLMHYAGTLAKRGAQNRAYEAYMEAVDRLEAVSADPYQKHQLYQDMSHMLLRFADFQVSAPVLAYDTRRLDLALSVLHEKKSSRYIQRALQLYADGQLDDAIQYGRSALILAWRAGDWSMRDEAYSKLALLYMANKQPIEALYAAIHAGDDKLVRECAAQVATTTESDQVEPIVTVLLTSWTSLPEQQSALVALKGCADIIPEDYLEQVIDFALDKLKLFNEDSLGREVSRHAAGLLKVLVSRLSPTNIARVLRASIDYVPHARPHLTRGELVRLIGASFETELVEDLELQELAAEALLSLTENESLREYTDTALLHLGTNATNAVRDQIAAYFRRTADWIYLAALEEPVSESEIMEAITRVLEAITPHWTNGSIGYSGWRAQTIVNFNQILPPTLYEMVVEGLLEAASNQDGFPNQRADAILTLRWLPDEVVGPQTERIAKTLLGLFEEPAGESERASITLFGGPPSQIEQSALYTLGYLYKWAIPDQQQAILKRALLSIAHDDSLVRTGAAMALRQLVGTEPVPFELAMGLERLLIDDDPTVRHWAGAATGHLVIQSLLSAPFHDYFAERLANLARNDQDAFARSGMAYGLKVIVENHEADSLPEVVSRTLNELTDDVSYQVRRLARREQEDG